MSLNPLENYPNLRKRVYEGYGVLVVLLGALSVGFANYGERPQWLLAAGEVLLYLGGALGLTAAKNVVTGPQVGQDFPVLRDADTEPE